MTDLDQFQCGLRRRSTWAKFRPPAIYEKYQRRQQQDRAAKMRKQAAAEFMGVLTTEQREQFDKMRGPKFDVDMSEIVGEGP